MATYMFEIKETAEMTKRFVSGNLKNPLLSILPYVFILGLIGAVCAVTLPWVKVLMDLFIGYFGALFATHFHRAYIQNHEIKTFNPLKPNRDDWRYIGIGIAIYLGMFIIGFIVGFFSTQAMGKAGALVALPLIPLMIYLALRLSLIFPDYATGGHLKIKEAFNMSRGLAWKIFATPIVAGWKWILGIIGWIFMSRFIAVLINDDVKSQAYQILVFFLDAPVTFGVSYYLTGIAVTTLSNYYLWAKNNQAR